MEEAESKLSKDSGIEVSLLCPYCRFESTFHNVEITKKEYVCSKCNKKFLAIVGTIKATKRIKKPLANETTVRIKNIEGGESIFVVGLGKKSDTTLSKGDMVAAINKPWCQSLNCELNS